jgi:hypothetical protein
MNASPIDSCPPPPLRLRPPLARAIDVLRDLAPPLLVLPLDRGLVVAFLAI